MKDILTKLTMSLGEAMASKETNILYNIEEAKDWKLDVILQFITANINSSDTVDKAFELAKDLGLTNKAKMYGDKSFWDAKIKDMRKAIKKDNKNQEVTKASKTIRSTSSSYGCGSSSSYGCGSSSRHSSSSYGCGGSSSRSYGC